MGVDQHRKHAQGFVVFDKPHAAHVGSEIVDVRNAFRDPVAGFGELQVGDHVLRVGRPEIPVIDWLLVHGAHRHTFRQEVTNELAADKSSGPSHQCKL